MDAAQRKAKRDYYHKNKKHIKVWRQSYYEKNREAIRAQHKKWEREHPEKKKEYGRRDWEKRKEAIRQQRWAERLDLLAVYGAKCVCCGEKNPRFLTIDHVNNDGHLTRKGNEGRNFARNLKKQGYPQKGYQLLCYNCNCGRAHNKGLCPHHEEMLT